MVLETVLLLGLATRCVLDIVGAVVYRKKMDARTTLLTAAAALPEGASITEHASDGSGWSVSVTHTTTEGV